MLLFPRAAGTFFRDSIVRACGRQGLVPQIKHESIHAYSLLKLVEKDIGVSLMPKSILQGYNLQLQYWEMPNLKIPLDLVVSYRTDVDHTLPQKIMELIRELQF